MSEEYAGSALWGKRDSSESAGHAGSALPSEMWDLPAAGRGYRNGINYVVLPNGDHVVESEGGMIVHVGGGTAIRSSIDYKDFKGGPHAY